MHYSYFINIRSFDSTALGEKSSVSCTFKYLFMLEKRCVRSLIAQHRLALYIDGPFLSGSVLLLEALRLLHLGGAFR